jgi:hypothetical protein
MSENKFIARNKFVSKLENKITEMNQSLQLLAKVDTKLFLKQSGGSGLYTLGINIADLDARSKLWAKALDNTKGLTEKLKALEANVTEYQKKLKTILDTMIVPDDVDISSLDTLLSLDDEALKLATAVFAKIYNSKGKDKSSIKSDISVGSTEFKNYIDKLATDKITSDDAYKIKAEFDAQVNAQIDR